MKKSSTLKIRSSRSRRKSSTLPSEYFSVSCFLREIHALSRSRPTKDVKAEDKEEIKVEAVKEDKPSGDAQPI